MKYIKKYEETTYQPEVGDYILIDTKDINIISDIVANMINNSIGKIKNIDAKFQDYVWVKYEDSEQLYPFDKSHIIYHSKNKKDIQIILDTKKYNL